MGDRGGSPSQVEINQTMAGLYALMGNISAREKTDKQIDWAHKFLTWFMFVSNTRSAFYRATSDKWELGFS
jgi:hypothetical protein